MKASDGRKMGGRAMDGGEDGAARKDNERRRQKTEDGAGVSLCWERRERSQQEEKPLRLTGRGGMEGTDGPLFVYLKKGHQTGALFCDVPSRSVAHGP